MSGPDKIFAIGTVEVEAAGRILTVMTIRTLMAVALLSAPALAQNPDTTALKAQVLAADRALAASAAKNGAAAFLSQIEPGAAVLIPGQPILKGPDASRAAFVARYGGQSSYRWTPAHAVVSTDGKLACTMGYSTFINTLDSVKSAKSGTYLTCWTKDSNGKWKVAGTQRADSPPKGSAFADSAVLPGAPHSPTSSSGAKSLAAAQEADSLFAMMGAEGPGPAFAKYAAEDGMLVGGEQFPRGPEAIAAAFKDYSPDRVIWWRPSRDFGAGTGGLAFTVGNSTSGPRAGKAGPTIANKYFTVWRQEPDGRWLYIFDLGSSRPTP